MITDRREMMGAGDIEAAKYAYNVKAQIELFWASLHCVLGGGCDMSPQHTVIFFRM